MSNSAVVRILPARKSSMSFENAFGVGTFFLTSAIFFLTMAVSLGQLWSWHTSDRAAVISILLYARSAARSAAVRGFICRKGSGIPSALESRSAAAT